AAFCALPLVAAKARSAVCVLDCVADAVLKSAQIGQYCRDVGSGGRHDYFFVGVRFAAAFFFVAGFFAGAFAGAFALVFAGVFATDLFERCTSLAPARPASAAFVLPCAAAFS